MTDSAKTPNCQCELGAMYAEGIAPICSHFDAVDEDDCEDCCDECRHREACHPPALMVAA